MPGMPRTNKKASKIAFDILGTPPNMRVKATGSAKSKQSTENEKRLLFEETTRAR